MTKTTFTEPDNPIASKVEAREVNGCVYIYYVGHQYPICEMHRSRSPEINKLNANRIVKAMNNQISPETDFEQARRDA